MKTRTNTTNANLHREQIRLIMTEAVKQLRVKPGPPAGQWAAELWDLPEADELKVTGKI